MAERLISFNQLAEPYGCDDECRLDAVYELTIYVGDDSVEVSTEHYCNDHALTTLIQLLGQTLCDHRKFAGGPYCAEMACHNYVEKHREKT